MKETAVDRLYRRMFLECTFDTNKNIYENCKMKETIDLKAIYDLGFRDGITNSENNSFNREEAFMYWYNEIFNK